MADFDETFDFVVAGSGGGSMCAALMMRSLGRSVLILEKTEYVGGTTARSGGVMWIPNNPFMKRDGVADSFEEADRYLDAVVGDDDAMPGASRARRRAYLRQAPRMVEFLVQQGLDMDRVPYWPDYYDDRPGGSEAGRTVIAKPFDTNRLGAWREKLQPGFLPMPVLLDDALKIRTLKQSWKGRAMILKIGLRTIVARLRGQRWVSAGAALQGRMLEASLKAGVDIRTQAPVKELIVEDGRVTGVVIEKDGRPWRVGARSGVLVNAGGFAHNQRMRDTYQPGTQARWTVVTKGDTGEMIEEMMRHGAAVAQMGEMVGYQTMTPPGSEDAPITPSMQSVTAAPHVILVDQGGSRYMNEGGSYMAYCKAMLERNRTVPAVHSWAVFDSQYLAKYGLANGIVAGWKVKVWIAAGFMKTGATVAALADKIGADPATLTATVDRFNGFVAAGRDADFHRGERAYDRWLGDPYNPSSATLGSIEKGPFYALPVVPGDVGTYGGVVTDTDARVLREDGSPIEGLYATGISTASVMGGAYPGAGSSVGPSFTWGFVAAKHAAGADNVAAGSIAA
ncbi:FAD-dependent oxidoreductase [Sphingomonas naphthae]|uniref:FAD-dependent oxidoreductase n=1 Tax=Sphingomonas naphthae TaxID=1813468 RepID=A0ABY7TMI3_9SPHN|nr:FAD-dependent oxidoreductase [Sphingomonas naphthae]WCT73615.1 FAD-dependent oxidoreductase [Sphingomonas naphthae]